MKLTKKNLRNLVKEMIKVDKGLIKESKSHRTPLRQMILQEVRMSKGLLKEAPVTIGSNAVINPADFKKLSSEGAIVIKGFSEADVKYQIGSGTRIQVAVYNELPARAKDKTRAKINEMLGVVYDDTTKIDGKITIIPNRNLIQKVIDNYGSAQEGVKQTIEIAIPKGVRLFINGVEQK